MLEYAENLLGYRPDYIFSHATRMVLSKALWRDLRVLEHLEWALAAQGKQAVLFIVSTAVPAGRRGEDVHHWEWAYGWPVGAGLTARPAGAEAPFFFQQWSHSIESSGDSAAGQPVRWNRKCCGWRIPAR
jgi:hypothetical protein